MSGKLQDEMALLERASGVGAGFDMAEMQMIEAGGIAMEYAVRGAPKTRRRSC
jgi:hypothetical protein